MNAFLRWLAPAFALLLHAEISAASPAPEALGDAEAAYAQGRYADAARRFEGMARAHGVSAALYYDLGAAQLAAGELGPAILSFERGRWLAPRDRGIASGLRMARERAGLPASESSGWRRALRVASADEWAATAALALVLASAGAALLLLEPGGRLGGKRSRQLVYGVTAAALSCW